MTLGWRWVLILQLGSNAASSSQESDFAKDVGSATGHLPLFPLIDRGTLWFISCKVPRSSSPCKDFNRAWLQLCTALTSIPSPGAYTCRSCVQGLIMEWVSSMPTAFHPGSRNCILPIIAVLL